MKLSGAVRNHRANELPAARVRRTTEPRAGARSISDSEQFDEGLYSCNNLYVKKSTFRTINLLSQTIRFDNI